MLLFLIIGGLLKKARYFRLHFIQFVDRVLMHQIAILHLKNLMASYGYAIQIYCDFSGYSDIAIGLALLMGFGCLIILEHLYQSGSITEFWRRWHISLSSWLRLLYTFH